MNYIYRLMNEEQILDQTALDEADIEHAAHLFFNEMGWTESVGMSITLFRVSKED